MHLKKAIPFFLLAIAMTLGSTAHAQSLLSGKITDARTGEAIIGAVISLQLSDPPLSVLSNTEGDYLIRLPGPGKHKLRVLYTGYEEQIFEIESQTENALTRDISLTEANYLLQTLVISASRTDKPLAESSVSMDIIRPDYPEKLNSTSAQQVLDRIPGVQILDGQANIRGGSGYSYGAGSRVMLVMDDLPILQPDAGFPNWDDLPLENVGQIEVLKGAGSALYGSAAMNGIIHFRNIKPGTEPYTAISLIPRIFMKPALDNQWWGKGNDVVPGELVTTLVHRKRYRKTDVTLGGFYANKTGYNKGNNSENTRINGIFTHHFSDRLIAGLGVNLNAGHSTSFFYWDGEGSYVGDSSSYSNSKKLRFNLDPSVQYFSSGGYRHKLMTRWSHINNEVDNNQSNQSDNYYAEYQIHRNFEKSGLEFTAGALTYYSRVDANLYSNSIFKATNQAAYVQMEKRFWERLILSGGMRYEHFFLNGPDSVGKTAIENPSRESKPVFRLGANCRIGRASYLRASWGQGFRFPTIAERFVTTSAGGVNVVPNPLLQPEYGNNFETGVRTGYAFGPLQGMIDLAWFWSRYQDMMEFTLLFQDFRLLFQSQNVGDTDIKGFEITNQSKIDLGRSIILISGGYTYLDPRFVEWDTSGKNVPINRLDQATQGQRNAFASTSKDNILKYRSRHLLRCDLEYQYRDFFIGANYNYASHMEAVDWLFEVDLFIKGAKSFRQKYNKGYQVLDLRMGYRLGKVNLQLNLANAFNEIYSLRPGLLEAPRNLSARMTWVL